MSPTIPRAVKIWALLVAATFGSVFLSEGYLPLGSARYAGAAVLCIALFKVRFIILDFMELRTAPTLARILVESWVVLMALTLTGLYFR